MSFVQFVRQYKFEYPHEIPGGVGDVEDLSEEPETWLSKYAQLKQAATSAAYGFTSGATLLQMPTISGDPGLASFALLKLSPPPPLPFRPFHFDETVFLPHPRRILNLHLLSNELMVIVYI
jgi:hypothetical protein